MGSFYVNHTVQTTDRKKIEDLLAGRHAFISPVSDRIVVAYDQDSDSQDEDIIVDLAKMLSAKLETVVFAVLNHDDDILIYWLFDRGAQVDAYNSMPDYFVDTTEPRGPQGGNAKMLCEKFGSPNIEAIERILRSDDYVFALDRHIDLLKALGLKLEISYLGYRHLVSGDYPDGFGKNDFLEVGSKL